ncbi:cysteine proteinase [Mycena pura]|uniref:Cysteine proteinase n=1 Tax=Mycena pura TaxID=153505 RepID=A0AAD7E3Q2_9AGAR|nr:cysteine proteinase [Mycena pura]
MAVNARKRSGDALPRPPRKQPRLAMRAVDGGNPSPGGNSAIANQRLRARWVAHFTTGLKNGWSFAQGTVELVVDTLFPQAPVLPMYTSTENTAHASPAKPPRPPIPIAPSAPSTLTKDGVPAEESPPPLPSAPAVELPVARSSRPPPILWPSTANTQTYYPQVDKELRNTVRRQHKRATRQHIFAKQHKMHVQAAMAGAREELLKELYLLQQRKGYSSDFTTFKGFIKKQTLIKRYMRSRSSSLTDLGRQTRAKAEDEDTDFLRRAIEKAQATLNGPKPIQPLTPGINQLQFRYRTKDNELERRLRRPPLPSNLPPEDDAKVAAVLNKRGVISKYAKEQVTDQDIVRLQPGKWLNDEVINFYGALILGRSEACKENPSKNSRGKSPLDVHYFSTFFWTKLEKEGYEKGRLAKWTKKVDIFSKDTILVPINHDNVHWTGAAINFRQKRIESYDSMHEERQLVYKLLRQYVDLEHRNKKKKPFDFTGWEDFASEEDTPMQENGYDCGVFTCQFLESLSRGEEKFNFTQKDIPYLRRRMLWEIAHGTLRTEH